MSRNFNEEVRKVAEKIISILVRFRMGGFGGIRGPTIEEALKALRIHGFPEQLLDKKVQKILQEFRNQRNNKTSFYTAQEAEQDLLSLLKNWQKKETKERRKNVATF